MIALINKFDEINIITKVEIETISLKNFELTFIKKEGNNNYYKTDKPIPLNRDLYINVNNVDLYLLIGNVTLTNEFEKKFRYDGKLGYQYSKDKTIFKLFTPVAKEVKLVVDNVEHNMEYTEPIWKTTINEDLEGKKYFYLVRINNTLEKVEDPYAFAAAYDGNYIIDFNKTIKINKTPIKIDNYYESIIYELHVRDATIALDVKNKGLFEGLLETSKKLNGNVIDHIKDLGITHLQLLPVYDFDGVDDINKSKLYNWGYNPRRYFSIDGWYSLDPHDPYLRINEFKNVINYAHSINLGINMDVVYNHVYETENYPYDKLVPGYFYRHDKNYKMTNSSFCGNDVETTNYMVRKLIVDSLIHFTKNFQIDGYRFDLMGLMDIETMKLIEEKLKEINPNIMLYGEGWNMETEIKEIAANMNNQNKLKSYGHFNDSFRDYLKGELHGSNKGYIMGNNENIEEVMEAITGSKNLFDTINQTVNYLECHDNLTMYDRMLLTKEHKRKIKIYQDFGNHIIAVSRGISFYHAGQEFYRTKKGDENSYKSSDKINRIKWVNKGDNINKFKEILSLRKKYIETFNSDDFTINYKNGLIEYNIKDKTNNFIIYFKNDFKDHHIKTSDKLVFYSKSVKLTNDGYILNYPGVYINKRA